MAITIAAKTSKPDSPELSNLCYDLVESLKQSSRHLEAAQILTEYCQNPDDAITTVMQGNHWDEALRIVCESKHARTHHFEVFYTQPHATREVESIARTIESFGILF
jgi:hypothetical protein